MEELGRNSMQENTRIFDVVWNRAFQAHRYKRIGLYSTKSSAVIGAVSRYSLAAFIPVPLLDA